MLELFSYAFNSPSIEATNTPELNHCKYFLSFTKMFLVLFLFVIIFFLDSEMD